MRGRTISASESVRFSSGLATGVVTEAKPTALAGNGDLEVGVGAETDASLSIEAVARRTGVGAATLRKWEQRYGVPRPGRTSGRHRRYTERDVLRIEWLTKRLSEGYRISDAAQRLAISPKEASLDVSKLVDEVCAAAEAGGEERVERALVEAYALSADPLREVVIAALVRLAEQPSR